MSTTGFDRNKILELLTELGRRLSAKAFRRAGCALWPARSFPFPRVSASRWIRASLQNWTAEWPTCTPGHATEARGYWSWSACRHQMAVATLAATPTTATPAIPNSPGPD